MSPEEKAFRNAYVRLMRYHTAARDEQAATSGDSYGPEDYVIFELADIHTGPVEEIFDRSVAELVTSPAGEMLAVTAHHLRHGNGPEHAYYDVQWRSESASIGYNEKTTTADFLRNAGDRLADVDRYTSYQVTARLAGKARTYRAMAFHHSRVESSSEARPEIIDNITSEMNTALGEESPRVRSPWKTYVKSSLYLAVAREIRDKRTMGLPLIPDNSPIGYLPGDDVALGAQDADFFLALTCEPPVEVPRIEWVRQEIIDESQQGEEVTECGRFVVKVKYRVSCDPVVHSLEVEGHIAEDADFICNQSSELVQNDNNEVCTWVVRKLYRMRNRMSQETGTAFTSYRAKLTEGSKTVTKDGPGVSVRATIPGTATCQGSVPCQ